MARKDVDLVVRAKDEAESVIRSITKALNDFNKAQDTTEDKAAKSDTALGRLGSALSQLQKDIKGLSVGQRIASEMAKADAAVARLEKSAADTGVELARLQKQAADTGTQAARLEGKMDGASAAMARQKQSITALKANLATVKGLYVDAAAATASLSKANDGLPGKIEKQQVAVAKVAQRYEELSAAAAAAEKPSKTLQARLDSASKSLENQRAKLAALTAEYGTVQSKLTAAVAAQAALESKVKQTETTLARQQVILAKIGTNYADLATKTKAAAQAQNVAAGALEKVEDRLRRETGQLETARAATIQLGKAAGFAEAELSKLSASGVAVLEKSLLGQRRAMLEAKKDYVKLSAAATALAGDIGRAGVPTREMSEKFAVLKARAAAAKVELAGQRETLLRMTQAYREGGQSLSGMEATQARFIELQEKQAAVLVKTRTNLEQQVAATRRLHTATEAVTRLPPIPGPGPKPPKEVDKLAEAYRRLYGDSRKSLSLNQRLRGEVLSLIAAYGGFYGVINLLGQVVGAYTQLEGAQARLNVANDGNLTRSAEEMDFLRRNANRLGVDLGTLANEYSKFAIATQGTNLAGQKTRDIFISVAEAGRVARISNEDLSGVFNALTQIVSKGAVQLEELKGQLGDRLPGALNIMADGLGVTTKELIKMIEAGELGADALVPFAAELEKRFGPGLSSALEGTSVALGRLKNAAFQALLAFGKGGFIDAFNLFVNDLSDLLQSSDFSAFVANASAGVAGLISILSVLADNFEIVVAVISALIGRKLAMFFIESTLALKGLVVASRAARAENLALGASLKGIGVQATFATRAMRGLTAAAKFFTSSTFVGLILTGVAGAIGYWATQADVATEAMDRHREMVDRVKNAYDAADGSVTEWRANINDLTVTEAQKSLDDLRGILKGVADDFDELATSAGLLGKGSRPVFLGADPVQVAAVAKLRDEFLAGTRSGEDFLDALDDLNREYDKGTTQSRKYGQEVLAAGKKLVEASKGVSDGEKVIVALTGTVEDAGVALDELTGKAEDAGTAIQDNITEAMTRLQDAVGKLTEMAPKAKTGVEEIAAAADQLRKNYEEALAAISAMPGELARAGEAQKALNSLTEGMAAAYAAVQGLVDGQFGGSTDATGITAELLRGFEGFRSTPYDDGARDGNGNRVGPAVYRAGFGSDTITLSDGTIQKVTQGITVSVEDANRDLIRRINTEFMPLAASAAGADRFAQFTPQQQAALTSIAYNYGEIPARIAEAVRTGTTEEIATAIRGLAGDNGGINQGRRLQEAALFASTASVEPLAAEQVAADAEAAEDARKAREEAAELAAKEAAATKERIADNEFAIEQQALINAGKERQAAIDDAIRAARADNPNITQAEIDLIAQQTGAYYDLAHAEEIANKPKEAAKKAEEAINLLLEKRAALQSQMDQAIKDQDLSTQESLRQEIAGVNAELEKAIDNAIAMWTAVGGAEADTAIAKLTASKIEAQNFSDSAKQNYLDWSRLAGLFVDGLAGAFDTFSKAVADGVEPLKAARDAFLQFAADFLIEIAQMIIKQAIFNMLQKALGGTSFGALIGLAHTGGKVGSQMAGSGNQSRRVSPNMFIGAPRYHSGGIVGLQPGEVPIIAQEGERILTEEQDKALAKEQQASTAAAGAAGDVAIINAWDAPSLLKAALSAPAGAKILFNWLQENSGAVSNLR